MLILYQLYQYQLSLYNLRSAWGVVLLLLALPLYAQTPKENFADVFSNSRCRTVSPRFEADSTATYYFTHQPDSLSLLPDSIRVVQIWPASASVSFTYSLSNNQLRWQWLPNSPQPDSIRFCYTVLPYLLSERAYKRDQAKYDSGFYEQMPDEGSPLSVLNEREELFSYEGLRKNGSITRGISFGTRQDVFVNSALNLQLEGNISEDIHLTAVLSDQNVPFQPEGNTQQLQQFDRIFIRLAHRYVSFSAGDIVLQTPVRKARPESQFLRYYKNLLGVSAETTYGLPDSLAGKASHQAFTKVGAGVAKGRFHSQIVEVQEGVLGPYRLRGPDNERFIFILANSEKVYLDGRLLTRGFNYDYVIDYNTAEVTFTQKVVITRFSRVRVDVEFSVQNYSRSILSTEHWQRSGRLSFFTQFYQERDNPRNPLLVQLTQADRQLLSEIGDSLQLALAPAVFPADDWDPNRVLYIQRDTLVNGQSFRIYERALRPQPGLLLVTFSEVGFGRGDYEPGSPTANGREFRWVAPESGIPRGRFAPVRVLPAPNSRRMLSAGVSLAMREKERIFAETALSEVDINLYSTLDADDNRGYAIKAGYENSGTKIEEGLLAGWEWTAAADLEYNQRNFAPVDRFRDIEFDRDWSAEPLPNLQSGQLSGAPRLLPASDLIANIGAGLRKNTFNYLTLKHVRRERESAASGFQQYADAGLRFGRLQWTGSTFLMQNQQPETQATWQRFRSELAWQGNRWVPGYVFASDKNRLRSKGNDSISGTAMFFDEHKIYLKSGDSSRFSFLADFSIRNDQLPLEGQMAMANRSQMANLNLERRTDTQWLSLLLTYRNLSYLLPDSDGQSRQADETLNARLDWNASFLTNAIRSELTLASGSGRELRREFVFIQVNPGQGTHTWRDDNGDGVQQLNEFYIAINPDEKNFIKVFTPTDEYVNAYSANLSYRLNLGAPRAWASAKGFKSLLYRFSNVSAITVNRRFTDDDLLPRFFPLARLPDESVLSTQEILRSTFFFNRTVPRAGADLALLNSKQKQLLANGFESRQQQEAQLNLRYNIGKLFNIRISGAQSLRSNASDFLLNRNFSIRGTQLKPELAWQPGTRFRLAGNYTWQQKSNTLAEAEAEQATWHELAAEARWAQLAARSISARLRLVQIRYTGETNSPVGYEMLEALAPGFNTTWNLNWQQRLSNGLQINIQYEGRSAEGQRIVHIGRMQVTALF